MALDLTRDVPRSPFETLEGYAWLPRLIDKARAHAAGTGGDYTPYPCPGDRHFLGYFGLDAAALGALIRDGASDEAIATYVKANAKRTPAETAAFREALATRPRGWFMRLVVEWMRRGVRQRIGARGVQVDWSRVDTLAKLLALEEGHPVPGL